MKRLCTEDERNLLFKNRNQLLEGIYQTASRSNYSRIFVGLFFSIVSLFVGMYFILEYTKGSKWMFWLWFLIAFTIPNMIVSMIMNKIRIKKEAKAFLKKENLMINGATLVDMDMTLGAMVYIEDDFLDEDGRPYLVAYPAAASDLKPEDIGKRMIVMYDDEDSFQLMKVNEELRNLIPNYSEHYPLNREGDAYKFLPHPNAVKADYMGHKLSEEEKEKIAEDYVKLIQGEAFKVVKISGVIIFICIMFICVLLGVGGEIEGGLVTTIPAGLLVCLGVMGFILLMRQIGKVNLRRQAMKFDYVQEVIFYSYNVNQRGKTVSCEISIYEWAEDHFKLETYPGGNVSAKTQYGSVIYKYTNQKGGHIFINKK